jgi:hypothetical protein
MNIEKLGDDYIMFGSYELYDHICIRSYKDSIFLRIGHTGCEIENLHTGHKLNIIGVDLE